MSNLNYRSLVWNFPTSQLFNKFENLQKSALRFLLNNYDSTYEDLLKKSRYEFKETESTVHRNL